MAVSSNEEKEKEKNCLEPEASKCLASGSSFSNVNQDSKAHLKMIATLDINFSIEALEHFKAVVNVHEVLDPSLDPSWSHLEHDAD